MVEVSIENKKKYIDNQDSVVLEPLLLKKFGLMTLWSRPTYVQCYVLPSDCSEQVIEI